MSDSPAAPVRELGLRDVVLFNIAAVVSIRWLATAAHIGPGSLVLWAGAGVFFFVPLALAVGRADEALPGRRRALRVDRRSLRRVARIPLRLVVLGQ